MNFKLTVQYDGTHFHGWQIQTGERTVQGELTRVLSLLEGGDVFVCGSGRTDAGVHAEGQVANVKLGREFTAEKLRAAINGNLDKDVRVMAVEEAPEEFHARFSATGKTYRYTVVNAPVISPFRVRYAAHETRPLDAGRMAEAAELFVGRHDWTAFSAAQSDSEDRVRTIRSFSVEKNAEGQEGALVTFTVTGDGFLRYMVRSLAGTLLEVGRGEKDFDTIRSAIDTGDRRLAGSTAPAHGLTLLKVFY
jgi:tRNA pseudouridine38-40 synthase